MAPNILFWAIPGPTIESLSLILRDDCMMEELRTSTAIGYSVRRGNLPRKLDRMRD